MKEVKRNFKGYTTFSLYIYESCKDKSKEKKEGEYMILGMVHLGTVGPRIQYARKEKDGVLRMFG